jgi:hypothetical protein
LNSIAQIILDHFAGFSNNDDDVDSKNGGLFSLNETKGFFIIQNELNSKYPDFLNLCHGDAIKFDDGYEFTLVFRIDYSPAVQFMIVTFRTHEGSKRVSSVSVDIGDHDAEASFRKPRASDIAHLREGSTSDIWAFFGLSGISHWMETELEVTITTDCVPSKISQTIELTPAPGSVWHRC